MVFGALGFRLSGSGPSAYLDFELFLVPGSFKAEEKSPN